MSPRLAFALETATKAGKFTLGHFQTGTAVETKEDQTPVTAADKGAERLIREAIELAFPNEQILGEEEGGDATTPDRWVIDPIDGTKSFICGVPLYATLLSYEQDFEPILGIAYFPALAELVYAERGSGTFLNGRPVRVSQRNTVKGSVLCCGGHRSMKERGRAPGFERLAQSALATRTWSDAYGHALVVTGRVEAMLDPVVTRWDLSAVALLVEEAGGRFTRFDGHKVLTHDRALEAVSSNGHVHEEILEAFRG